MPSGNDIGIPGAGVVRSIRSSGDIGAGPGTTDGGVDTNALLYFLVQFESASPAADLDNDGDPASGTPDGGVDINDLLFFLARFEARC